MKPNILPIIEGKRIYLRAVEEADANAEYIAWLSDSEVNKYMETRFERHTLSSLQDYIQKAKSDPGSLFFMIVRADTQKPIGTIKLGSLYWQHRFGTISLMLGDRESWGKGFGTEAIKLLTKYAFSDLGLHKIIAGIYRSNIASIKAFEKAGFKEEAVQQKQYWYDGRYIDQVLYVNFNEEKDE